MQVTHAEPKSDISPLTSKVMFSFWDIRKTWRFLVKDKKKKKNIKKEAVKMCAHFMRHSVTMFLTVPGPNHLFSTRFAP